MAQSNHLSYRDYLEYRKFACLASIFSWENKLTGWPDYADVHTSFTPHFQCWYLKAKSPQSLESSMGPSLAQMTPWNPNPNKGTGSKMAAIRLRAWPLGPLNLGWWERSGSVVEYVSRDRGVADSSLTGVTALCPWARHINSYLVLVQSRKTHPHIAKNVDWDVKNQTKQTTSDDPVKHSVAPCWVSPRPWEVASRPRAQCCPSLLYREGGGFNYIIFAISDHFASSGVD